MSIHPNLRSLQLICLTGCLSAGIACNGPSQESKSPVADTLHHIGRDTIYLKGDSSKAMMLSSPISALCEMDGKYPAEVKLFDNALLLSRLKSMIGKQNYRLLRENWNVESPISVKNGIFTAEGCMQHNCDATNFIIVAYIQKDKIYAGIREEGKVTTFGEDSTTMPAIETWRNK